MRKILMILISSVIILTPILSYAAEKDITELEDTLEKTIDDIEDLDKKIANKNKLIKKQQKKIDKLSKKEETLREKMQDRIKILYENQSISSILCSVDSINNLTKNTKIITEIINYDRKKLDEYTEVIDEIKETQQKTKEEKQELNNIKKEKKSKEKELRSEIQKRTNTLKGSISGAKVTYTTANDYGYSDQELDLICAIVAQECSSSYEGSLAVITCAMNRCASSRWKYLGKDPLSQLCARGQFTYSIDGHYKKRLNGNYKKFVKTAVLDALAGKRNHEYLSFRGYRKPGSVNIGGNWYFNKK